MGYLRMVGGKKEIQVLLYKRPIHPLHPCPCMEFVALYTIFSVGGIFFMPIESKLHLKRKIHSCLFSEWRLKYQYLHYQVKWKLVETNSQRIII